jgi:hypothetical protein
LLRSDDTDILHRTHPDSLPEAFDDSSAAGDFIMIFSETGNTNRRSALPPPGFVLPRKR